MNNSTTINHIFTDGAAPNNQIGCTQGGIGVAVYTEDGELSQTYMSAVRPEARSTTTNVRCEMLAVIKGLEVAEGSDIIHTDNKMISQGFNEWLKKWKATGWKGSTKKPVANKDLWLIIGELKQQKPDVTITWIKGHAGIEGNELADSLATEAANM